MDQSESLSLSPPGDGEVAELVKYLRGVKSLHCQRAAELLERLSPVPVPVSDRPWQRQGWCDKEGRFWAEHISRSGVASWRFAAASDLGGWAFRCLPFHALPLPTPNLTTEYQ